MRVPRSVLFVPGDRPERFDKAVASGADLVVLDLEDAVRPDAKDPARRNVRRWLAAGGRAAIRVNGVDTPWYQEDVTVLETPGIVAAMLPKAEEAEALERLGTLLSDDVTIIALIETALGVWNAGDIARVTTVSRIAFGSIDFQFDCGIAESREALLYARSQLVLASAVSGIAPPLDGATVQLDDEHRLEADIVHARTLGFGGKLCIHPAQIAHVNAAYRPDDATLAWARRVVDAASNQKAGAIRLDGELIDRPFVDRARRLLKDSDS